MHLKNNNKATFLDPKKTILPLPNQPSMMKIGFVLIPHFNMMSLTTTIEPMRVANYLLPTPFYSWDYISFGNKTVTASNDMSLDCIAINSEESHYDLIFVFGGWTGEHDFNTNLYPKLCHWLRKQARHGATLCAFELSIYIFADAGLLDNQHITTHWSLIAGFWEQYRDLKISEQLFTINENILSCAGGIAGIDLMLYLLGTHLSTHLVSEVADQILHYPTRAAETFQRHTLGGTTGAIHTDVKATVQLIQDHISEPLRVPEIAKAVGISQRQLERHCNRYMGCSVVQLSQLLRLQHARTLLVSTRLSILDVSVASGFNSMSHFAQTFRKYFGKKPSHYRQAWPENEGNPTWPGTLFSFSSALKSSIDQ